MDASYISKNAGDICGTLFSADARHVLILRSGKHGPVPREVIKGLGLSRKTIAMGVSDSGIENKLVQEFTNKLLKEVTQDDNNYLLSPLSAEIVLAMVYQGAAKATAEKTANILNVTDKKSAAEKYKNMIEALNALTSVTLHMANKIYIMQDYPLKSNFQNVIEDSFMSRADLVDFTDTEKATSDINKWVESKTNYKIKDIISSDSLNDLTRLVLVNALYFKGDWTYPFKPEDTSSEPFYVNDDETVECEMMFGFDDLKICEYSDKLSASIVELPYLNDEASMLIVLPHEYDGIEELEKQMSNVDLSTLMDPDIEPESVEVYLPKFKIEAATDVKLLLEQMGLDDLFDPFAADFSEMSDRPDGLHISEFLQKTYIDVNEMGTEAAAASSCGIMLLSGPKRFTADHPFMFVLQSHGENGNTILFVGKVIRPTHTLPF